MPIDPMSSDSMAANGPSPTAINSTSSTTKFGVHRSAANTDRTTSLTEGCGVVLAAASSASTKAMAAPPSVARNAIEIVSASEAMIDGLCHSSPMLGGSICSSRLTTKWKSRTKVIGFASR